MAKNKKLTKRQKAFVKAIVDPNVTTLAEAGRIAGYKDAGQPYETLKNPIVQDALSKFHLDLVADGVDNKALIKALKDGLDATETRFFSYEGSVVDEREVPDHTIRLKSVELVAKIRGLIRSDKEPTKNTQVNVYNFKDVKTEDLLRSINEQLAAFDPSKLTGPEQNSPTG